MKVLNQVKCDYVIITKVKTCPGRKNDYFVILVFKGLTVR